MGAEEEEKKLERIYGFKVLGMGILVRYAAGRLIKEIK